MRVLAALAPIVIAASLTVAAAASGGDSRFCSAPNVTVLVDGSASVNNPLFVVETRAVAGVANQLGRCRRPPRLWVAGFATRVTLREPLDRRNLPGQLRRLRSALGPQWTDPAAAVAAARSGSSADMPVLVITDGAIEPGPRDGPPADPAAYLARLRGLEAAGPLFLWALRAGPDPAFDRAFAPIWHQIEADGLGRLDVVPFGALPGPAFPLGQATTHQPAAPTAAGARSHTTDRSVASPAGEPLTLRQWLLLTAAGLILWGPLLWRLLAPMPPPAPYRDLQIRAGNQLELVRVRERQEATVVTPGGRHLRVIFEAGQVLVAAGRRLRAVPLAGAVNVDGVQVRQHHPGLPPSRPWPADPGTDFTLDDQEQRNAQHAGEAS